MVILILRMIAAPDNSSICHMIIQCIEETFPSIPFSSVEYAAVLHDQSVICPYNHDGCSIRFGTGLGHLQNGVQNDRQKVIIT
jgi:hypothetical protein